MTDTTLTMDSGRYVKRGVQNGMDTRAWADRFTALGGEACRVRCGETRDTMSVRVRGTAEAIAFVRESIGA